MMADTLQNKAAQIVSDMERMLTERLDAVLAEKARADYRFKSQIANVEQSCTRHVLEDFLEALYRSSSNDV